MKFNPSQQTIGWFKDRYQETTLTIKPPYQRKPVWTARQKCYLIESILMDLPIPEIHIHQRVSPDGKTSYAIVDGQQRVRTIQALDNQSNIRNFLAAVWYLLTHPASTGKVGVVGFCWGGGIANQLAVNSPELIAVVPFYGRQPASEDVPKIKAPLLLHYAGLDEEINRGIPAYEAALKKASIDYKIYMYEGAQHAFLNDTNAERYNKEAAELAWQRTISFGVGELHGLRQVRVLGAEALLELGVLPHRPPALLDAVALELG